jgi:hypothetical protein
VMNQLAEDRNQTEGLCERTEIPKKRVNLYLIIIIKRQNFRSFFCLSIFFVCLPLTTE